LTELEREIFRDEPAQDHPTRLSPMPEPLYPTMAEPEETEPEPIEAVVEPELAPPEPAHAEVLPAPLREVPVDSHREAERDELAAEPEPEQWQPQPDPVDPEPVIAFNHQPEVTTPNTPNKPDTAMRIAVGLGAAACVLLAAVLYEGGWLSKVITGSPTAARVSVTASVRPSVRPSATVHASAPPSLSPTAAPIPALFTLGNGVSGGTVFRIRPGTAVAGYTRLVFDIRGSGLPTMVITKPDDLHLAVTFKDTSAAGVPVNGIQSYQVASIEPAVQQGADGVITIDLARPVRVTAFTLPATGSYAWRLVLDLHTS
jgi:hypothetical protein